MRSKSFLVGKRPSTGRVGNGRCDDGRLGTVRAGTRSIAAEAVRPASGAEYIRRTSAESPETGKAVEAFLSCRQRQSHQSVEC